MRNIALPIITTVLIAALSGCASGPSYTIKEGWVKQDISYLQSQQQLIICKEKAKATAERDTLVGGLIESCMTLEGYSWGQYKTRIR